METQTANKMTSIKIIFNDDVKIIDFLSDMHDRAPLKALQRFVNYSHQEPVCLLHNCPKDDMVVLILYKAPLGFNQGTNKLILYAYVDLIGLYSYFHRWIDRTKETDKEVFGALNDILGLISHELYEQSNDNVQLDFLG